MHTAVCMLACAPSQLKTVFTRKPDSLLVPPLDILQNFNLNFGRLSVFWDALDDFDCHILLLCPIPALRHLAECALPDYFQDLVAR